jgi:two-component system, NarL family, sensor kinase
MGYKRQLIGIATFLSLILSKGVMAQVPVLRAQATAAQTDTARVRLLCDIAWEYKDLPGDSAAWYLDKAFRLADKIGDDHGKGLVFVMQGILYRNANDLQSAETSFLKARDIRLRLRNFKEVGQVDNNLGRLKTKQGNMVAANAYFLEALGYLRQAGDSTEVAKVLSNLSTFHKNLGDYNIALKIGFQALAIRAAAHDTVDMGQSLLGIGGIYECMGSSEDALRSYVQAKAYFAAKNNQRQLGNVLTNLGNVEEFSNNYASALRYYRESLAYLEILKDTGSAINVHNNIAVIYAQLGDPARARAELSLALELLGDTPAPKPYYALKTLSAQLMLWEGKPKAAKKLLEGMRDSVLQLQNPVLQKEIYDLLSLAQAGLQNWPEAARYSQLASQLRHKIELKSNGSLYQYERYLEERMRAEKAEIALLLAQERSKFYILLNVILGLSLLFLLIFGLQRLFILQAKRKAEVAEQALNEKANEVERILQGQELKALQTIVDTENKERQRIALDLHDRVGGQLAAFKLIFSQFTSQALIASPALASQNAKLSTVLDDLMSEVRAVAHNLQNPTLRDFGLVAALEGVRDSLAYKADLDFELIIHGLDQRLGFQIEMDIFSILSELLNNAIRNGQATEISMQLLRDVHGINIIVEDNGIGFDRNDASFKAGLGFQSIDKRVKAMRGIWKIDSVLGRGSIFTFEIPITS